MIELRNISFQYPDASTRALAEVTCTFGDGSFVAVMGANGSGKSTLARCLNGLLLPASGEVMVNGIDTADEMRKKEIPHLVGLIFQNPHLQITSLTVERELAFGLQNLGLPQEEIHRRVNRQLKSFGLEQYRASAPLTLSAGEQQRLALASLLAMEPAWLVLDEGTSLLSPSSRTLLMDAVGDARKERSMGFLLMTQFPQEALRAERLLVLHKGRLALDGPPSDIFGRGAGLREFGITPPLRSLFGLPA